MACCIFGVLKWLTTSDKPIAAGMPAQRAAATSSAAFGMQKASPSATTVLARKPAGVNRTLPAS
ncbi:hypothetical protein D3C71_1329500 [compost metagenome]